MVPMREAEATAREFANRFADGSVVDATALLTDEGRAAVVETFPDGFGEESMDAEDALERYRSGLHAQYGDLQGVSDVTASKDEAIDGGTEAIVTFEFEAGTEAATIEVTADGVVGSSFSPAYEPPAYVDRGAFGERAVSVDAGDVSLDGVLALPTGPGPFPGVALVHGAGVHDPDGTVGASKLLRDFAWGLASEGIATLRYEKRLADQDVPDEELTLDAVVDDAVAALAELAAIDRVAEEALFVAGHSQGGMAAPRIAAQHGSVAGVVLDGRADSTLDPDDLDFMRYEFEPDGDLSDAQEAELDRERETARRIAEGDFEDDETL